MSNARERKAQKSPFNPACPHCQSKETVIDPSVRSNWWREYFVYAGMVIGAMTVTLHMRCDECGKPFQAWKNKTTPPG